MGNKNSRSTEITNSIEMLNEVVSEVFMSVSQKTGAFAAIDQDVVIKTKCPDRGWLLRAQELCYDALPKNPSTQQLQACNDAGACLVLDGATITNQADVKQVVIAELDTALVNQMHADIDTKFDQKLKELQDGLAAMGTDLVRGLANAANIGGSNKEEKNIRNLTDVKTLVKTTMSTDFVNEIKSSVQTAQDIRLETIDGTAVIADGSILKNETLTSVIMDATSKTAAGQYLTAKLKSEQSQTAESELSGPFTVIKDIVGAISANAMISGIVLICLIALGAYFLFKGGSVGSAPPPERYPKPFT
jgi:hypothetical protein